ncbi:MAG: dynamin family protein [Acidobacteriota bacterium]
MQQLVEGLERLATLSQHAGLPRLAAEAQQAAAQASQTRFNVAVLGQFKRGKSSVLNALIGQALLPTDVLPTTGVVTVVSALDDASLLVTDAAGNVQPAPMAALAELITEEQNPHNQKGILKVTVPCRCSLTESGVELVDTPGLGSIFQHSAHRAREFLPRVDVALLVLGADPPLTGEELELAVEASQVASALWVVVNKADLWGDSQGKVLDCTARVLREKLPVPFQGPWPVSAKRALEEGFDPGIDQLRNQLLQLAREKRQVMAIASARRTLKVLAEQALSHCRLQEHALTAPLAQLEASMATFREEVRHADDLAQAAMVRARQAFRLDLAKLEEVRQNEERRLLKAVRRLCLRFALGERTNRQALDRFLQESLPGLVQGALEAVSAAYWRELQAAYAAYSQELSQAFGRLLQPIRLLAKKLFAVDIAGFSPPPLPPPAALPACDPVIPALALDWGWLRSLAFKLLPARLRAPLAVIRGRQLATEWWRRGYGELQARYAQLVDETVRRGQAVMEKRRWQLEQEILATLEAARKARAQGEAQVATELSRLQHLKEKLHALLDLAGS